MDRFESLPKTSGVYTFSDGKNLIYIGKAMNIQSRVKNHFQQPSYRDKLFIDKVKKINYIKTDSEIEALILEANLIKKYQPKYNVVWKDGKNYFYVAVRKGDKKIPYIFITHQPKMDRNPTSIQSIQFLGPFVEGTALKKTLRFLRKVFPYYTAAKHSKIKCAYCHLDLCPGPNPNLLEYRKNIKKLILILKGKRSAVLNSLKKEMRQASAKQDFEKAGKIRDQISALQKIMSHASVINNKLGGRQTSPQLNGKIECYDISNIQGKQATGSMVVFINGEPDKNQYRKFKIRLPEKPNDIAMLKEILTRRFKHTEWPIPNAILIDGGKAQLNIAIKIKKETATLCEQSFSQGHKDKISNLKILSIAKGRQELFTEDKKNPIPLKQLPQETYNLIKQLDDEAHRFALSYHKTLRKKNLF